MRQRAVLAMALACPGRIIVNETLKHSGPRNKRAVRHRRRFSRRIVRFGNALQAISRRSPRELALDAARAAIA